MDDDIQSPGIEERHMYTGPDKHPWWKSYYHPEDDAELADKKLKSCMVVAIDFDDTITLNPRYFSGLVSGIKSRGGKAYLVTGRSMNDSSEVKSMIRRYCMEFDGEFYYPVPYNQGWVSWDALHDVRVGAWKAKVLSEVGADALIEDNPVFIDQVVRRIPSVTVFKPIGGNANE